MLLKKDKQKVIFTKEIIPVEVDHSQSSNAKTSNIASTSRTPINVQRKSNQTNINKRSSKNNPAYGWDYGTNIRSLGLRPRGFT